MYSQSSFKESLLPILYCLDNMIISNTLSKYRSKCVLSHYIYTTQDSGLKIEISVKFKEVTQFDSRAKITVFENK